MLGRGVFFSFCFHADVVQAEHSASPWKPGANDPTAHELVEAAIAVIDRDSFVPLIQEHYSASLEILHRLGLADEEPAATTNNRT